MQIPRSRTLSLFAASLLVAGSAGCARPAEKTVEPSRPPVEAKSDPATQPAPAAEDDEPRVTIYLVKDEHLAPTQRVSTEPPGSVSEAAEAIMMILGGPTPDEQRAGLGTVIPEATWLRGLSVDGDTATVDLNKEFESGGGSLSMRLRVAQIVYTLTGDTVKRVAFTIDGKPVDAIGGEGVMVDPPVTRADFKDLAPE